MLLAYRFDNNVVSRLYMEVIHALKLSKWVGRADKVVVVKPIADVNRQTRWDVEALAEHMKGKLTDTPDWARTRSATSLFADLVDILLEHGAKPPDAKRVAENWIKRPFDPNSIRDTLSYISPKQFLQLREQL